MTATPMPSNQLASAAKRLGGQWLRVGLWPCIPPSQWRQAAELELRVDTSHPCKLVLDALDSVRESGAMAPTDGQTNGQRSGSTRDNSDPNVLKSEPDLPDLPSMSCRFGTLSENTAPSAFPELLLWPSSVGID